MSGWVFEASAPARRSGWQRAGRKARTSKQRQVPSFALLERFVEAGGALGPINAKGGSSYSVALRGVGIHSDTGAETEAGTIRLRPCGFLHGTTPAQVGLRRDCLSVPMARTDKKWPPRGAAEVELIVMKEVTFQLPRPECPAWLPSGRSPLRSFRGRDCRAPGAVPSHLPEPRR